MTTPTMTSRDRTVTQSPLRTYIPPAHVPFDLTEIEALASRQPEMTVSILASMRPPGGAASEGPSPVQALIARSRELATAAVGAARAERLLRPLERWQEAPPARDPPEQAVALFGRERDVTALWLPGPVIDEAVVCDRCSIRPLMPFIQGDGHFQLLVLALRGLQLFAGTRRGLHPIPIAPAVASHAAVLEMPVSDDRNSASLLPPAGMNSPRPLSQASDDSGPDRARIADCMRAIDKGLMSVIHAHQAPLVVAGVPDIIELYRTLTTYPNLVPGGIRMDAHPPATTDLHAQAWDLVAPHLIHTADQSRARIAAGIGTADAAVSVDLGTVLGAGVHHRLAHLVIADDTNCWGTFDRIHLQLREHDSPWPSDNDLVNLALTLAFQSHAYAEIIPRSHIPGGSDVAALFCS